MRQFSCEDAKQIDMVAYLASLNYHPQKVHNQDYWYLSPLREEKTPSFKINQQKNVWYDHGLGKGGDLIDFGVIYHNCSIRELLQRLSTFIGRPVISFHSPADSSSSFPSAPSGAGEEKDPNTSKIVLLDTCSLNSKALLNYLEKRCISLDVAREYCMEVDFLLYEKKHTVIGFQNKSGGFELRNEKYKCSSSPKDITFIDNGKQQVVVFEGFFNYLAFQTLSQKEIQPQANFLILNSLSFFEKSRNLMEAHREVYLLLDRDSAGLNYTAKALTWHIKKYIDRSQIYENHKDLNDWLIDELRSLNQNIRRGRRI
ncbi:toprim domain-containing protein [Longitalea luteola]|uniref:toprim domain-containing protein n=1 Tax=Longitalea luteola TaxID=2812563 RepID=UPI001A95CD3A|nr:toprim domain-containing protein [Longitalea luteola]